MTWQPEEHDGDEAARVQKARQAAAQIKQRALRDGVGRLGRYEQALVTRPIDLFDDADFTALDRILWAYRDRLPLSARLSLTIPPDDPIVRESALNHA